MRLSSHSQFLSFVRKELIRHYQNFQEGRKKLQLYGSVIAKILSVDLSGVCDILKDQYSSSKRGKRPWDPASMLRSLLLMTLLREPSITQWVKRMRGEPLFAILSGFSPDKTPGVGTFYDFIKRLYPQGDENLIKRERLREFKPKPKKRLKQGEKLPPKHPGIVEKLVNRVISGKGMLSSNHSEYILNRILKDCFVCPSLARGILGKGKGFSVSGDSTKIKSGGSPYGTKVCDCKEKGIYRCTCPRRYSDPFASWGWDSYHEDWIWGRSLYELIDQESPYDLPIFLKMAQAQRHDSVLGIATLYEARRLYEDHSFKEFSGDSAHDAYPIYRLLDHWDMGAIITLNPKNEGHFIYDPALESTEDGTPICKGGFKMVYQGYCRNRCRLKYRCPKVLGKIDYCKYFNCSDSTYGRVIYTKPKWDLRLFTRTPRGTDLWRKKYDKHSGSERSNKRKKLDYGLERARVRSNRQWFTRCALIAMCQHLDAWYQEAKIELELFISRLVEEPIAAN